MKAEEPASAHRAEKYGMPIEFAEHIVQRHFDVLDDNAALAGGQLAADIEQSRVLSKARDRTVQASAPAPTSSVAITVQVADAVPSWRAKLGLS